MRDPNRIDRMIELLREAWHRNPDWRLTQLVINATDTSYDCDKPHECGLGLVYYIEDETMEKRLRGMGGGRRTPPEDASNASQPITAANAGSPSLGV